MEEFVHELESGKSSFDFADGTDATVGEDLNGGAIDRNTAFEGELADDAASGFSIWHSDFDDHSGHEAADEALVKLVDIAGVVITGEDDAGAGESDRVEGAEEFFLGGVFVGEEMNIVDGEEAVPADSLAKCVEIAGSDGGDVFIGEIFAGDVADGGAAVELCVSAANPVEQVRLSEAAPTVDAEGGESYVAGGEFEGGVEGEFVSLPGDELVKVIAGVEAVGGESIRAGLT